MTDKKRANSADAEPSLPTGTSNMQTVHEIAPRTAEELELVAGLLSEALIAILRAEEISLRGLSSGVFTFLMRHLDTSLAYFYGQPENFGRLQLEYLKALQHLTQHVGNQAPRGTEGQAN